MSFILAVNKQMLTKFMYLHFIHNKKQVYKFWIQISLLYKMVYTTVPKYGLNINIHVDIKILYLLLDIEKCCCFDINARAGLATGTLLYVLILYPGNSETFISRHASPNCRVELNRITHNMSI